MEERRIMDAKQMESMTLDVMCELSKKHGINEVVRAAPFAIKMLKLLSEIKGTADESIALVVLEMFRKMLDVVSLKAHNGR